MLDHEMTMEYLRKAKQGDENAKEILIKENSPLIKSIIKRFVGHGVDYDDLYSIACVGFMKAINNFDFSLSLKFSTYVVPMCIGEVKRFLRDDGIIKISRAVKVLSYKISKYVEEYRNTYGEDPKIAQISNYFNVPETDVVYALEIKNEPIYAYSKKDEDDCPIIDKIKGKDDYLKIDDKIILKNALKSLDERERKILILRYFRDKTQSEIAKYFGLSQVQISRIESKIIKKLKLQFEEE